MKLSLVIPVYNEEENVLPVASAIESALRGIEYEIIFVDDGSTDKTAQNILELGNKNIHLLTLARNFGQTSAMAAGIETATGQYIATLDGDLQNDPADIPAMIKKLEDEKLDMVAGCRKNRKDGWVFRKIPSIVANKLIRKITDIHMHDYGCTLKLFKNSLAKDLDLYGELHRFIPVLADMKGAKIAEMDVKHHPRQFGESKYGLNRTFRVASDLMLMAFFIRYSQRPMHLFGTLGLMAGLTGGLIETYLLVIKLTGEDIGGRPLFYVGILLIIASIQLITTGFVAELLMRTYFNSRNRRPYIVAKRYTGGKEVK